VGGFYEAFSCRGDPGIGFDYEFGIRLWKQGYQVGLTIQGFRYHAGSTRSGGTRSSTAMKSRRDMLESRNTAFIHLLYKVRFTTCSGQYCSGSKTLTQTTNLMAEALSPQGCATPRAGILQ